MKLQIYQTPGMGKRGWRWRLKGGNGKIIAASSQAFSSQQSAKRNARLTRDRLASIMFRQWKQL